MTPSDATAVRNPLFEETATALILLGFERKDLGLDRVSDFFVHPRGTIAAIFGARVRFYRNMMELGNLGESHLGAVNVILAVHDVWQESI